MVLTNHHNYTAISYSAFEDTKVCKAYHLYCEAINYKQVICLITNTAPDTCAVIVLYESYMYQIVYLTMLGLMMSWINPFQEPHLYNWLYEISLVNHSVYTNKFILIIQHIVLPRKCNSQLTALLKNIYQLILRLIERHCFRFLRIVIDYMINAIKHKIVKHIQTRRVWR